MARLNIEEKWKSDPRRRLLAQRLGSDRLADGMLMEIGWLVLAHKGQGIPLAEFKYVANSDDWMASGLGCTDGDWVRIAGSSQYKEYFEKQKTNGGKGGRRPKPKLTQTNPDEPNHNPNKPSFSSSFSSLANSPNFDLSRDSASSDVPKKKTKNLPSVGQPPSGGAVPVAIYCKAYKAKYGHSPKVGKGKRPGILNRLFGDYGLAMFEDIIAGYFEMPDAFLVQRSHPVELIDTKLNEIVRFLETGKVVSRGLAKEYDDKVTDELTPQVSMTAILAERQAALTGKGET